MSVEIPRGRFVWYELMTSDPTAARSFYSQLTGWSTQEWDGAQMPYTMWMNGETAVGGLMQLPEEAKQQGAPPHWLAYIATPDADATVAVVSDRGGRLLHGPVDIPTVGRVAVLIDPQGAVFAAHTTAGTPRPAHHRGTMAPGGSESSLGTSWPRPIPMRHSGFTVICLDGPRPKPWTWAPEAPIRCSVGRAIDRWAVSSRSRPRCPVRRPGSFM